MIAIIPARGGSKGLPGKNIKLFSGKPLISHTIRAAQRSDGVSRIIVSTDTEEIANVALAEGAEVPFMRPDYLASDNALAVDTYLYTCERLMQEENSKIDEFMVLQPTSPLRTDKNIDEAINLFQTSKAETLVSVCEAPHPVEWFHTINPEGCLKPFIKEKLKNRQEYKSFYIPNGAILILKYEYLKEYRTYYSEKTVPYIMPKEQSIDIDSLEDFEFAEYLFRKVR